jgi:hypothetical protein
VSAYALALTSSAYAIARGIAKNGVAADPNVPANHKLVPTGKDMHPRR